MAILEEPIKGVPLIKNFIGGEWVESKGEVKDVVNPAKCETIAKVPISTEDEIDAAVKAAQEVVHQRYTQYTSGNKFVAISTFVRSAP